MDKLNIINASPAPDSWLVNHSFSIKNLSFNKKDKGLLNDNLGNRDH